MNAVTKIPNAVLGAVLKVAARRLGRPVLMAVIDDQHDGSFYASLATHGLTRGHIEGAALTTLRALRDDVGGCPDCPACQDRAVRVAAAIAALEARPAQGVQ